MNSKVSSWVFAACFLVGGLAVVWSQRSRHGGVPGTAAQSSRPLRHSFPQGGYGIVLRHTGEASRQDDLLFASVAAFNIVGIAAQAKLGGESPVFQATSLREPWLYDQARPEPPQTVDILASDGLTWRLQLEVLVDGRDESPRLDALVGRQIQVHAERFQFGVGRFAALRLSDADGLVVALDFRSFRPGEDADLAADTGATLDVSADQCGSYETKTLELAADAPLSLRPGQHATLPVHDQDYEAWNLASTMLTQHQNCTDMFSNFAWFVERRPD